jgi:hypothetical protein
VKNHRTKIKICGVIISILFLLLIGLHGIVYASYIGNSKTYMVTKVKNQIEIPAGSDYYIKFNSLNKKLEKEELIPVSTGLSEMELQAVAKAPTWIQRKLIQQFQKINNSDDYVQLLLKSDMQFTDEIAFTIAHSPLGNVPSVEVIEENAHILYQIDPFIQYADIIDYDEGNGYYYSTLRYWVLENDTTIQYEYPMDIYYWYVVHPRVNREEPMLVYERTWRNYLFCHNDVGHPLMKENVDDVPHLWDGKSSSQNTAIQSLGHWIGNTIRYEIIGDRSGQPNIIAHEHTGYCGEAQKIRVSAFRTALIPINGVMNYAEDHVWAEFYERGWYHYDGAVNNPYLYTDGWGKDMSSIWGWNGDSSIYEVTSKYIHPEDRITVEFNITDGYNNPIDGAIVTVLVKGLKDITWYKDYFSDILDAIWEKTPNILKGRILERIYDSLHQKIDDVEEVIDTYQVSIWNYTDNNGLCTIELGKDDEYIFLIQKPNIGYPWPISSYNRVKILSETKDTTYNIRLNDFSNKIPTHKELGDIQGDYKFNLKLNLTSYQLQRNIITRDIGTYNFLGIIDFFIVDEENFELYQNGKKFNCFFYQELQDSEIDFSLNGQDYYLIFRNHAHMTNVILDYEIYIESSDDIDRLGIVTPSTDIFEEPIYTIGTRVYIGGIATSDSLTITIGNETEIITTQHNTWQYQWDTTHRVPGSYLISVANENSIDTKYVKLIDTIPPSVEIINPKNLDIFENDIVTISGRASDNYKLNKVELIIDENIPITLDGIEEWSYNLDIKNLDPGEHLIQAIVYDNFGLTSCKDIIIIRNESNIEWHPTINSLFITPENPTNTSNIIVYSNVTTDSPFSIKKVILCYDNGTGPIRHEMFRYGDFPPQERHIEDDIQNIPNDPIYGFELGKFQTGEIISCWIEAFDTKTSSMITFEIK